VDRAFPERVELAGACIDPCCADTLRLLCAAVEELVTITLCTSARRPSTFIIHRRLNVVPRREDEFILVIIANRNFVFSS